MRILVVDDELGLRHTLTQILAGEGYDVAAAADGAAALEALAADERDLVLCDVRMPAMDGLAFLDRYRERGGRALVIMMSAYGDDDHAIEAIRRGAYDFISKPFRADQVQLVIRKAIEREKLRREVEHLRQEVAMLRPSEEIVGRSGPLRDLLALARRAARHPTTVLITGESGTGKELIARLVHRESPRAERPFVAVNCAAIPENLLESELFGHVKGAFTGATTDRRGLFEEAHGGTIFLDEIGELPQQLQVKLLRVLQEGEIRRVGDSASQTVDVRVVAATARDLEAEVGAGKFRADLFYRINVVRLHLPPLRERREDIAELSRHFLQVHAGRLGIAVTGIAPAAMQILLAHPWPGNVRELENAIERALVLCDRTQLEPGHLPETVRNPGSSPRISSNGSAVHDADGADLSVKRRTEALERELIRRALEQTAGNRTRAAQLLDLSHRALLYKIRNYRLE